MQQEGNAMNTGAAQIAAAPKRPNVDINALTGFLNSLQSYSVDLVLTLQVTQPLYHYTDLGGLLGIVEKSDLWLTHSRFSNDDEEMIHGMKVAAGVLREELDKAGAALDRIAYLNRVTELLTKPNPEGVYICCFCTKDNLLSQWRGYGANGSGVSLQFEPLEFSTRTGVACPHGLLWFWKVFYEPDRQRKIIARAIDFYDEPMQRVAPMELRAQQAVDAIQFFIPTFKNADFSDEQEWRLIFTPQPACPVLPRFRVARNMLVPYYSLKELGSHLPNVQRLPIQSVRVGPSAQKALNVESIRMVLAQSGYTAVPVQASDTPYRG
jgi:hypothetical protein